MKILSRILGRIALIAVAAAVFMGLTALYARTIHPPSAQERARREMRFNRGPGDRRGPNGDRREGGGSNQRREGPEGHRRQNEIRLSAFPEIFKEGGLFALITVASRKILRLRL